ncbi:MAG: 4-hydroxy-tetrahydrodipicolinate synthase [Candidatus Latescibacteria bacterium]|nr:4-hydroxy-tetrahydrodipicolinate synthase [Candidatus Latescibacterota bacterium]
MKLLGSLVALVTPFTKKNELNLEGLKQNIVFQLDNKTSGFVPCGTTGESPTLSEPEWTEVVKITVNTVKGKKPVIPGTGTNSTDKTIKLTQKAQDLGADAALVVTPYYNKPTQEGLYQHYRAIARAVNLPIIIYNIVGRTAVNMLPETITRLHREFPKIIIGVKEASGSLDQVTEIIRRCGKGFIVLSGDDSLTLPILSVGGKGVISVIANIVPKAIAEMIEYYFKGENKKVVELNKKLFALSKAMFIETNPSPIKYAMSVLGMPSGKVRLPLVEPTVNNQKLIKQALQDYPILKIKD